MKEKKVEAWKLFEKLRPAATLNKWERIQWNEWHLQFWLAIDRLRDKAIAEQSPTVAEVEALRDMLSDIPYVEV